MRLFTTHSQKIWIGAVAFILLSLLGIKLYYSEQLRLAWNRPRYLYDGRHHLSGNAAAAQLSVRGELQIGDNRLGSNCWNKSLRLIPQSGLDMVGEQSISFSAQRQATRLMYKLRAMATTSAVAEAHQTRFSNKDLINTSTLPNLAWLLFWEQRTYHGDNLFGLHKDLAYGPGGFYFLNPDTGQRWAAPYTSTLYVPSPTVASGAGPSNWLWAAVANRQFTENTATANWVQAHWDQHYYQKSTPPHHSTDPGNEGQMAHDGEYLYLYQQGRWLRYRGESF